MFCRLIFLSLDFRGYTIRKKKWSPEQEAKVKIILNTARNRVEAQKLMQKEGFTSDEAARFAHRYYRTFRARGGNSRDSQASPNGKKSPFGSPSKKGLTPKDQQQQLVALSQSVHLMNQDLHKILRKNKSGIPLNLLNKLPSDYKRPPGFVLVPGLLGSIPGGESSQNNNKPGSSNNRKGQNDRNNNTNTKEEPGDRIRYNPLYVKLNLELTIFLSFSLHLILH